MAKFLSDTLGRKAVTQVTSIDLQRWMQTLVGEYSTMKTERENLKSFWRWCFNSDLTPKNVAAMLPPIGDPRRQKIKRIPTLTPEEIRTIIVAAGNRMERSSSGTNRLKGSASGWARRCRSMMRGVW